MRALPLYAPASQGPRTVATPRPRAPITSRLMALKARIFCHGLRIDEALWAELTDENHYRHKRAGLSQGRFFRLLDGESATAVNAPVREPFARTSPLHLRREGDGYAVFEGEERLCEAVPFAWPRWYQRDASNGQPMSTVVSAHCDTSLYTAIYQGGCDYWHDDKMCAFCAMKIDQRSQWRPVELIIEVAKAAQAENPAAEISFGGGTRLTEDKGAKHKSKAIAAFKREVDMPVCVEMAPPDTDDWIDRLKDAGLDAVLFNMELWGDDRRRELMPGKAAITRERYLDALGYAAKVLGPNQASSQVIVGLEPLRETLKAVRAIVDVGAIPLPVVFRPLPGTALAEHPTPPVDEVLEVFEKTHSWMEDARLAGLQSRSGCALCGACSAHR